MKLKKHTMKKIARLFIYFIFLLPSMSFGQVEKVIVEKYYISDSNDQSDTLGGFLQAGSTTYRVYIDLKAGSKLLKIYGNQNHTLKFSSTTAFFNNKADGQTFAKDFSKNRYNENTVALDTWLTLGQTTRLSTKTYFGVLKSEDRDGSFIGGTFNDGGSAGMSLGLIVNADPLAGIPPTVSDGMDTMTAIPTSWADYGILDSGNGNDSTMFGSLISKNEFSCNNCGLQNSGVEGINSDSNQVLIAQLTTIGELSFELNLEVQEPASPNPIVVKYVARLAPGEMNSDTLKISPYLKYPSACGCIDPNYLEFNQIYSCSNNDSCKTRIIYGCMDINACNYDPNANFNLQQLCCYPGSCSDRDLALVCPELSEGRNQTLKLVLSPNPGNEMTMLTFNLKEEQNVSIAVINILGKIILNKSLGVVSGAVEVPMELSNMKNGIYLVQMRTVDKVQSIKLIKE